MTITSQSVLVIPLGKFHLESITITIHSNQSLKDTTNFSSLQVVVAYFCAAYWATLPDPEIEQFWPDKEEIGVLDFP